jgi:hypothetical protein
MLLLASVGVALVAPTPAYAQACAPSDERTYFDGFYHKPEIYPQYNWKGASSYITVRWPLTCTDGWRPFTNAFVMIAPKENGLVNGWGQVGYLRYQNASGVTRFEGFAQFASDANRNGVFEGDELATHYLMTMATGDRPAFRVLWSSGCACLEASVNGVVYARSPFNPFTAGWRQPFVPQFLGETEYRSGNMPGTASVPTAFSALGAQRHSDGALVPMSCSMHVANDNPTLWGIRAHGCQAFDIWQR